MIRLIEKHATQTIEAADDSPQVLYRRSSAGYFVLFLINILESERERSLRSSLPAHPSAAKLYFNPPPMRNGLMGLY